LPLLETTLGLIKVDKKDTQQNLESKSSSSSTRQKIDKQSASNKDGSNSTELVEDRLIRENYGLVVSQALCFFNDSNFEDYVQAGLIGLLKAIRTHDKEKAIFSTYAIVCIKNSMSKLRKKLNRPSLTNKMEEFDAQFPYNSKDAILDYLPESLPEEYIFIIKMRLEGYTNKEISDYTSNTKKEISEKIRLIIQVLRDANS
jgi:RNA polymerase sigma factor (sigma-70 family)